MIAQPEPDTDFEALLEYIRATRGFDYTGYKRPSLARRFAKRMQAIGIESHADYRKYLEEHEDEFGELFDTILINVTSFFRDQPVWEYVAAEVIPRIVAAKAPHGPIRAWSTGCATGEEAYTLAILLAEALGEEQFMARVKIYATDADEDALRVGRHGAYTSKQLQPVPPELRDKYFERANDSGSVFRADLRRSVIFGRHDLIQDPPISRIDLLVSRNTLMYFTSELQKRVLASFHFALNPDGYLFLGKSEVLVARSSLFAPVDLKKRVFAKAGQRQLAPPAPAAGPIVRLERPPEPATDALVREAGADAAPIAQVIVERSGKLVFANLQARILFGIGAREIGAPFKDLELSYRPVELRSRIDQALSERHPISIHEVEWRSDSQTRWFDLQVTPLVSSRGEPLGAAITFTDVTRFKELQDALEVSKRDLETAYEELQSTVEELETTNEELQSTNEELETTNEELQSTNEELETMNEELQSTNEELETINDELQLRTDELNTANAFLESILATVDAGVIVVDADFDIAAWNPGSEELWGLREDEVVGSNVFGLDIGLPVHELRSGMRDALDGNEVEPVVVAATNRRGRALRCHVTFSRLNGPDGLVRGVILLVLEEPKEHES